MELLDEQGRLFGRVNVVDALVIVFALAVIVAGAALVFADSPSADETEPEETTMYVTIVTGGDAATALQAGEVDLDGASANVTDVHPTPGPRVYLRVALDGVETETGFRFAGDRVRLDDRFTVVTNTTQADGRVVQRDVAESFETETTTVTVETIVRPQVAEAVAAGDEHRVADSTVATVTAAESTPADDPDVDDGRTLTVTLEIETRTVDGVPHYGGRPVRIGRSVGVETDEYQFTAEVVERE